jgi:molecular chaperone Hsp33
MTQSDFITRFIFDNHSIRGEIVVLEQTITDIFDHHSYPPAVAQVLGEAVVATVLLSAILKIDGSTTLQARGNGPLQLLMAEATHERTVRGIARWQPAVEETNASFRTLLGNEATLAITLTPRQGNRYQGIVPLEKPTLAGCIEDYFQQSEQLRTGLWLFQHENRTGGVLLQELPARPSFDTAQSWQHIVALVQTLTAAELLSLPPEYVLFRLFHEEQVRLLDTAPVSFACTCSVERTRQAVSALGEQVARDILAEKGVVETVCQFCHQVYRLDEKQISQIFKKPGLH